jgi:hypothetical protein
MKTIWRCVTARILLLPMILGSAAAQAATAATTAPNAAIPDTAARAWEIVSTIYSEFTAPPAHVPTNVMPDGPLLGNGNLGVVIGGPADKLQFYVDRNDFWSVLRGRIMPMGSLQLSIPELSGAKYQMQENIGTADVTGNFTTHQGAGLAITAWIPTSQNMLVLELANTGKTTLNVGPELLDGWGNPGPRFTTRALGDYATLDVSAETQDVWIGNRPAQPPPPPPKRRMHNDDEDAAHPRLVFIPFVQSEAPFDGMISDVEISGEVNPSPRDNINSSTFYEWLDPQKMGLAITPHGVTQTDVDGRHAVQCDGKLHTYADGGRVPLGWLTFAAVAHIWIHSTGKQNVIISAQDEGFRNIDGQFMHGGFELSLVNGHLSARLNGVTVTAPDVLPTEQWVAVGAQYDGKTMTLLEDDKPAAYDRQNPYMTLLVGDAYAKTVASTSAFPSTAQVMGADWGAIHTGDLELPFYGSGPMGVLWMQFFVAPANTGQTPNSTPMRPLKITPGQKATIILSAGDDRDGIYYEDGTVMALASYQTLAALRSAHDAWWKNFWGKSYVELPDKLIQDEWYGSLYSLACCSKGGVPAPGLWGNWITTSKANWRDDYTLDYNYEAPFWAACPTNHPELMDSYDQVLLDWMPRAATEAKNRGYQGLYYLCHLAPVPGWSADQKEDEGQKSDGLFATVDCVMRWRYTHDLDYARKVYPFLARVAEFWDHYLTFKNGRYEDDNDPAEEFHNPDDINPTQCLAFLRLLYSNLIDMSTALNVDADKRTTWSNILAHLSELPVVDAATIRAGGDKAHPLTLADIFGKTFTQGKTVLLEAENRTEFSGGDYDDTFAPGYDEDPTISGIGGEFSLQAVFPGWNIGMESGAQLRAAALGTAEFQRGWYDGNADSSFYTAAANAGYDPNAILQHLHILIDDFGYPNYAYQMADGGIENFAIAPDTVCSMLVQSYQDQIHLFPDWPKNEDVAFGDLAACGGFLVSSAIKDGQIQYVKVISNQGQECRLENPWPGLQVTFAASGGKELVIKSGILSGAVLNLETAKGETIIFSPGGR